MTTTSSNSKTTSAGVDPRKWKKTTSRYAASRGKKSTNYAPLAKTTSSGTDSEKKKNGNDVANDIISSMAQYATKASQAPKTTTTKTTTPDMMSSVLNGIASDTASAKPKQQLYVQVPSPATGNSVTLPYFGEQTDAKTAQMEATSKVRSKANEGVAGASSSGAEQPTFHNFGQEKAVDMFTSDVLGDLYGAYASGEEPTDPVAKMIYKEDQARAEAQWLETATPTEKAAYRLQKATDAVGKVESTDEYEALEDELTGIRNSKGANGGQYQNPEDEAREEEILAQMDAMKKAARTELIDSRANYNVTADEEEKAELSAVDPTPYDKNNPRTTAYYAAADALTKAQMQREQLYSQIEVDLGSTKQQYQWYVDNGRMTEDEANQYIEEGRAALYEQYGGTAVDQAVQDAKLAVYKAGQALTPKEQKALGVGRDDMSVFTSDDRITDSDGELTSAKYNRNKQERIVDLNVLKTIESKYQTDGDLDPNEVLDAWLNSGEKGIFGQTKIKLNGEIVGSDAPNYEYIMGAYYLLGKAEGEDTTEQRSMVGIYAYATDAERETIRHIVTSGNAEDLASYMASLKNECYRRQTLSEKTSDEEFATLHPGLATATSIAASVTGPKAAEFVNGLVENATGASYAKKTYDAKVTRRCGTAISTISENIKAYNPETFTIAGKEYTTGDLWAFLYQTGVSMGESGARMFMGPLGLFLGGADAGSTVLLSCYERGCTSGQAIALGLVACAAEIITEKVSLDQILKAKTGKNLLENFYQALKTGFVEGTEEVAADLINDFADWAIMQDESTILSDAQALMAANPGMTQEEAVWKILLTQWAESFAGGYISGFGFGAVEQTTSVIQKGGWANVAKFQQEFAIDPKQRLEFTNEVYSWGMDRKTTSAWIDYIDSVADDPSLLATKKGAEQMGVLAETMKAVKESDAFSADVTAAKGKADAAIDYAGEMATAQAQAGNEAKKAKRAGRHSKNMEERNQKAEAKRQEVITGVQEIFQTAHDRSQGRHGMLLRQNAERQQITHDKAKLGATFANYAKEASACAAKGDYDGQRRAIAKMRDTYTEMQSVTSKGQNQTELERLEAQIFNEETEALISDAIEKNAEAYVGWKQNSAVTKYQITEDIKNGGYYESEQQPGTEQQTGIDRRTDAELQPGGEQQSGAQISDSSNSEVEQGNAETAGSQPGETGVSAVREWGETEREESVALVQGFNKYSGGEKVTLAPASTVTRYGTEQATSFQQKTGKSVAFYKSWNGPAGGNINGNIYVKDGPTVGVTIWHEYAEVLEQTVKGVEEAVNDAVQNIGQDLKERFIQAYRARNPETTKSYSDAKILAELAPDVFGIISDGESRADTLFITEDAYNAMSKEEQLEFSRQVHEAVDPIISAYEAGMAQATNGNAQTGTETEQATPEQGTAGESKITGIGFSSTSMKADKDLLKQDLLNSGIAGDVSEGAVMSTEELDTLFKTIDEAIKVIDQHADLLDHSIGVPKEKRAFSPYKQNSDPHYEMALDFSTLCRKRILLQSITESLQAKLKRSLTAEEQVAIRAKLQELQNEGMKVEVACALCYVEAARLKSPKVIKDFLADPGADVKDYFAKKNKEFKAAIEEKKAAWKIEHWSNAWGVEKEDAAKATKKQMPNKVSNALDKEVKKWRKAYVPSEQEQAIIDKAAGMDPASFLSAGSLTNMKLEDPEIYDAFISHVRSAARSKAQETEVAYHRGDIAQVTDALIEKMNKESGFRHQSWSDFEVTHLLDTISAVIELSTKHAKMHAYTKVADMVNLVGETGMMLNMSLIPAGQTGLDENGNLIWDDVEGFHGRDGRGYDLMLELRDKFSQTAGNIAIGINDQQILALLASDEIDYVIPYHVSGLNKGLRTKMNIPGWNDYTKYQNEVGDKKLFPALNEWFDAEAAKKAKDGTAFMVEASRKYLDLCNERGLTPKFPQFLQHNADGTYSLRADAQNYWKLLIDRKMVDQTTNKVIEQKAVVPHFSEESVMGILSDELVSPSHQDDERAQSIIEDMIMSGNVKISKEMKKDVEDYKAAQQRLFLKSITDQGKNIQDEMVNEAGATKGPGFSIVDSTLNGEVGFSAVAPGTNVHVTPDMDEYYVENVEIVQSYVKDADKWSFLNTDDNGILTITQPSAEQQDDYLKFKTAYENASGILNSVGYDNGYDVRTNHGTSLGGFTTPDINKTRWGLFGRGLYTTESNDIARSYIKKEKGQNPFVYNLAAKPGNELDMDAPFEAKDAKKWYEATVKAIMNGDKNDFARLVQGDFETLAREAKKEGIPFDENIMFQETRFFSNEEKENIKSLLNVIRNHMRDPRYLDSQKDLLRFEGELQTVLTGGGTNKLVESAKKSVAENEFSEDDYLDLAGRAGMSNASAFNVFYDIAREVIDTRSNPEVLGEIFEDLVKELGYDGIKHIGGLRAGHGQNLHNVHIFHDMSRVKSVDVLNPNMVYDDDGNIIPLSERFNTDKEDIRFSTVAPGRHKGDTDIMSETLNGMPEGKLTPHGKVQPTGTATQQAARRASRQAAMRTYEADLAAQMDDMAQMAARDRGELERTRTGYQRQLDTQAQRAEQQLARANERADARVARTEQRLQGRLDTQAQRAEQLRQRQDERDLARQMGDMRVNAARAHRDAENRAMRNMSITAIRARQELRREQQASETRQKSIDRIKRNAAELYNWTVRPNGKEGKSVPKFLQDTVVNLLTGIDIGTEQTTYKNGNPRQASRAATAWRQALKDLANFAEKYKADPAKDYINGFEEEFPQWFRDTVHSLNDTLEERDVEHVLDMTQDELDATNTLIGFVAGSVNTANQLHANARFQKISDLGETTINDATTRKKKRGSDNSVVKWLDKMVNTDMLSSFDFFRRLGTAGKSISKSLSKGFEKYYGNIRTLQKDTHDTLKNAGVTEKQINDWNSLKKGGHKFTLESGEDIELTTGQLMELYALSRRDAAYSHLFGDGITVANIDGNQQYRNHEFKLTEADVDNMLSELTDQQKALAEEFQTILSTTCSDMGNEVTEKQYMFDAFGEDYYWPMSVEGNARETAEPQASTAFNALLNAGFTNRVVKSGKPLKIGNAFDTYAQHVAEMAAYNGVALPVADLLKWTNYLSKDGEGNKIANRSVKQAVTDMAGENGMPYIINLIKDINGLSSGSTGLELQSKLAGNVKATAVSANPRVVIQQPTAIIRATWTLDPVYFLKQGNLAKNIKEMQEKSDLAFWKDQGNFDIGTGKSIYGMLFGDKNTREKLLNTLSAPAGAADNLGWGQIWGAVKAEVAAKNPDVETGSDEFFELVNDRFSDVINSSQVIDTLLHRSQIMRSKDALVKDTTSFMNEPIRTFNMFSNAVQDIKNGEPGAKKRLARTAVSVLASTAVNSFVKAIYDALKKREPEEPLDELIVENFKSNFVSDADPLGMIPYISKIKSVIDGYSADSMDLGAIDDVVNALERVKKWVSDGYTSKTYTTYGVISSLARAVGNLTGLPVSGILNTAETVANAIVPGSLASKSLSSNSQKRVALVQQAGVSQKAAKHFMSDYNGNSSNAIKAFKIATYDDDGNGTPDWDTDQQNMVAAVLGIDTKGESLTDYAEDAAVSHLKTRRTNCRKTGDQAGFEETYNIYEDYFELLGMDTSKLPKWDE